MNLEDLTSKGHSLTPIPISTKLSLSRILALAKPELGIITLGKRSSSSSKFVDHSKKGKCSVVLDVIFLFTFPPSQGTIALFIANAALLAIPYIGLFFLPILAPFPQP